MSAFQETPQFSSFFIAGFECTASLAENRRRLDLLASTKHDTLFREDYALLKQRNITTVREGLNWSRIDKGSGVYDFSRYEPMLKAGAELGIQQIWDLNHFDYPSYLDPFSKEFVSAFQMYALAAHHKLRKYQPHETLYITPLNEISFFAWIGADMGWWAPYKKTPKNGLLFKQQLVRATLASMDALWEKDSNIRFIHIDPFMRRLAVEPASRWTKQKVKEFNEIVRFEAWDMLAGKTYPELGGDMKYLDIIGINYYIHNQEWVFSGRNKEMKHQMIDWDNPDRISFADMLETMYQRYQRPIMISETGSFGSNRPKWWERILQETAVSINRNLPICGLCAYPILDRPESAGFLLPNSGLWDFHCDDEECTRIPHEDSLKIIERTLPQITNLFIAPN